MLTFSKLTFSKLTFFKPARLLLALLLLLGALSPAFAEEAIPLQEGESLDIYLARIFSEVELYHTLLAFDEELLTKLQPEFAEAVEDGATPRELLTVLTKAAQVKSPGYLGRASDETLANYYRGLLDGIRFYAGDPEHCILHMGLRLASGQPTHPLPPLPAAMLEEHQRVLSRLLWDYHTAPVMKDADEEQAIVALDAIFDSLAARYAPEERERIDSGRLAPGSEALFCRFFEEFYTSIFALPELDRANLLRLFANESR